LEIGLFQDERLSGRPFASPDRDRPPCVPRPASPPPPPLMSKDGATTRRWSSSATVPLGYPGVSQCNARDITDRNSVEGEAPAAQEASEFARDRAESRRGRLAAADLRRTSSSFAMLAHELRNPLAAVRNARRRTPRSSTRYNLNGSVLPNRPPYRQLRPPHQRLLDVSPAFALGRPLNKRLIDATPVLHHASRP